METLKLKRKFYNIHKLDFSKLISMGSIKNEGLHCNSRVMELAEIKRTYKDFKNIKSVEGTDVKGDCQLFDQTLLACPEIEDNQECFEKIYINIDFNSFMNEKNRSLSLSEQLLLIKDGIYLDYGEETIHFVDFLKSNSMSKNSCIYYINEKYVDRIEPRIFFGLNKGDLLISKWYAYSGLALSDAIILKGLRLRKGEVIVVPDSTTASKCDCITGISVPYLYETVSDFRHAVERILEKCEKEITIQEAIEKFGEDKLISDIVDFKNMFISMYESKDFARVKEESDDVDNLLFVRINQKHILSIIVRVIAKLNDSFENLMDEFNKIIQDYQLTPDSIISKELRENNIPYSKEVYWERFFVKQFPLEVNKFDGEGLMSKLFRKQIDESLNSLAVKENSDIEDSSSSDDIETSDDLKVRVHYYSMQIRLPFIKGVLHSIDLRKFISDHGIKQLYGLTYNGDDSNSLKAYDATKVKVILTESQFKAASFLKKCPEYDNECGSRFDAFIDKINEYGYSLGRAGTEGEWDKAHLNYQFLSTIPFPDSVVDSIIKYNIDEVKTKLSDKNIANNLIDKKSKYSKFEDEILKNHPAFYTSTSRFTERRAEYMDDLKRDLLRMKLNIPGYRKYLSGDLLELIYHACYHNVWSTSEFKTKIYPNIDFLNPVEFYAPNTDLKKHDNTGSFVLLRNPHYSRNEIAVKRAYDNKKGERVKYFGHLTGVCMINAISYDANRLGGADYDGDTVVILTDKYREKYISKLILNYGVPLASSYRYPIVNIPSLTSRNEVYCYANKVKCLENTFSGRVGLISNSAFHSAVYNYSDEGNKDHFDEVPFYTILSGLEIDSAKKGIKPYLINGPRDDVASLYLNLKKKAKERKAISQADKDNIEALCDSNIIIHIYKIIFDLDAKKEFPKTRAKRFVANESKVSLENLEKMFACTFIFNKICTQNIMKFRKKEHLINMNKDLNDNFKSLLISTNKYNHGIDRYINSFIVDNPYDALYQYCNFDNGLKFHYMVNKNEKLEFINSIGIEISDPEGDESLTNEVIDSICDFSDNGFYLLYFVIQALCGEEKKDYILDNSTFTYKEEDIEKRLKTVHVEFDKQQREDIKTLISEYAFEINRNVKYANNKKALNRNDIKNIQINYLRTKLKDVPFDNYIKLYRGADGMILYQVLIENLLTYLNEREGGSKNGK